MFNKSTRIKHIGIKKNTKKVYNYSNNILIMYINIMINKKLKWLFLLNKNEFHLNNKYLTKKSKYVKNNYYCNNITKFNNLYENQGIIGNKITSNKNKIKFLNFLVKNHNKVHLNVLDKYINSSNSNYFLKRPLLLDSIYTYINNNLVKNNLLLHRFFSKNIFYVGANKNKTLNLYINKYEFLVSSGKHYCPRNNVIPDDTKNSYLLIYKLKGIFNENMSVFLWKTNLLLDNKHISNNLYIKNIFKETLYYEFMGYTNEFFTSECKNLSLFDFLLLTDRYLSVNNKKSNKDRFLHSLVKNSFVYNKHKLKKINNNSIFVLSQSIYDVNNDSINYRLNIHNVNGLLTALEKIKYKFKNEKDVINSIIFLFPKIKYIYYYCLNNNNNKPYTNLYSTDLLNFYSHKFFERPYDFYISIYTLYLIKIFYFLHIKVQENKFFLKKFAWFYLMKQLKLKNLRTYGLYQSDMSNDKLSLERPYLWLKNRIYENTFFFLLSRPDMLVKFIFHTFSFNEIYYLYLNKNILNNNDISLLFNMFLFKYKNIKIPDVKYYNKFLLKKLKSTIYSAKELFWKSQLYLQCSETFKVKPLLDCTNKSLYDLYRSIDYTPITYFNGTSVYDYLSFPFNKNNCNPYNKYSELYDSNSTLINYLSFIGLTPNHLMFFSFCNYSKYITNCRILQTFLLPVGNSTIVDTACFSKLENLLLVRDNLGFDINQKPFFFECDENGNDNVNSLKKEETLSRVGPWNNYNFLTNERNFIKYYLNGLLFYNPLFFCISLYNNIHLNRCVYYNWFDSYDMNTQIIYYNKEIFHFKGNNMFSNFFSFQFNEMFSNKTSFLLKHLIKRSNFFIDNSSSYVVDTKSCDNLVALNMYNEYIKNFFFIKFFNLSFYRKNIKNDKEKINLYLSECSLKKYLIKYIDFHLNKNIISDDEHKILLQWIENI